MKSTYRQRDYLLGEKLNKEFNTTIFKNKLNSDIKIYDDVIFPFKIRDENFIKRYIKYVRPSDWTKISYSIPLSEKFIEENIFNLNFENLSRYQKLSKNFINKYSELISFPVLLNKNDFSNDIEFLKDLYNKGKINLIDIYRTQNLSKENLKTFTDNKEEINTALSYKKVVKFEFKEKDKFQKIIINNKNYYIGYSFYFLHNKHSGFIINRVSYDLTIKNDSVLIEKLDNLNKGILLLTLDKIKNILRPLRINLGVFIFKHIFKESDIISSGYESVTLNRCKLISIYEINKGVFFKSKRVNNNLKQKIFNEL